MPGQVIALSYTAFRHYDTSTPYLSLSDLSGALYIRPGDPIPGGWQPEGQPPVLYNSSPPTDPRQARFARAFAQRPTAVGEMVTVDIWAYVVGGTVPAFAWTDHEHKHTHPNAPQQVRSDIVWWRDPQFPGTQDIQVTLNPQGSPAPRWIRFSQWQQRSSGSLNLPSGLTRPVTVMDTHTGLAERDSGLSAVNCSVGWIQA